jgi:hypothetical protein
MSKLATVAPDSAPSATDRLLEAILGELREIRAVLRRQAAARGRERLIGEQRERRLHENATSFSWVHAAQRSRRNPWGEDAALEKSVELVFDELGQHRARLRLDLGQEGGCSWTS